ncbi:MAG: tetratricopeptide repeat protein [Chitinispirillaceae bacterium]
MKKSVFLPILCFGALLVLAGCAGTSDFPVVKPMPRISRAQIAKRRAHEYFIKARDYERRGLYQMAEHFYEMAYELDPESQLLLELLADRFVESGKYAQALVLVKGKKDIQELTEEQKRLVSTLYIRMGQFDKAAETLEALSDLSDQEHYSLGFVYEALGKHAKAAEQYRSFYSTNDESIDMGLKIARLYTQAGDMAQAESLYLQLNQSFGEDPQILNGLGKIRLIEKDTLEAMDLFRTALVLDSTNEEALHSLAQVAIKEDKLDEAIEYYKKLYAEGYVPTAYGRTLALLYYYDERLEQAEDILQELLSDHMDDQELHFYLGLVKIGQQDFVAAEIELEKAVSIQPSYEQAWQHLCFLNLKEKRYDRALSCALRFTENVSQYSDSWRMLGYVRNARKEYKEAKEALSRALSLDSTDVPAWFEIGSSYERSGEYDSAAQAFGRVLEIKPSDAAAANYLGYMWAEQGINLDSAQSLLEMALEQEPENGAFLDSYAWISKRPLSMLMKMRFYTATWVIYWQV